MSAHGLKAMSGKPQAEREANAQARLAKFRAMPVDKRVVAYNDGLNYTFAGGMGAFHAAKRNAVDDRFPPETRALFRQAVDWGYAAFAADKAGMTDLATHFAAQMGLAVTAAHCTNALGWVGDAKETT